MWSKASRNPKGRVPSRASRAPKIPHFKTRKKNLKIYLGVLQKFFEGGQKNSGNLEFLEKFRIFLKKIENFFWGTPKNFWGVAKKNQIFLKKIGKFWGNPKNFWGWPKNSGMLEFLTKIRKTNTGVPNTPFSKYVIFKIPHFQNTPFSKYPIFKIRHFQNTPFSKYVIFKIRHFQNTAFSKYVIFKIRP